MKYSDNPDIVEGLTSKLEDNYQNYNLGGKENNKVPGKENVLQKNLEKKKIRKYNMELDDRVADVILLYNLY